MTNTSTTHVDSIEIPKKISSDLGTNLIDTPTEKFTKFKRRVWNFFRSRAFKNTFKAALAYWLAFMLIFIHPFATWFKRPLTLSNIILATIVLSPGKTVGAFLQAFFFSLFGIFTGAALFAFLAGGLNQSPPLMMVFLLLIIYGVSVIRALIPKLFLFCLLVCLTSFQGVSNALINDKFDHEQLRDSTIGYLIGSGIALLINILIWPDSAESELRIKLMDSLDNLSTFNTLMIKTYLLTLTEEDKHARDKIAKVVRQDIATLMRMLDEADCEITYSEFSMKNFKGWVSKIKRLHQFLLALHSNLTRQEDAIKNSDKFRKEFLEVLREPLNNLDTGCRRAIAVIKDQIDPNIPKQHHDLESHGKTSETGANWKMGDCDILLENTLSIFEQKQYDIMANLFHLDEEVEGAHLLSKSLVVESKELDIIDDDNEIYEYKDNEDTSRETLDENELMWSNPESTWADLFMVYFFMFGIREYVEGLLELRRHVLNKPGLGESAIQRKKKLRFHFNSFVPSISQNPAKKLAELWKPTSDKPYRTLLSENLNSLKSPLNLYAIKTAIAVGIVLIPLLIDNNKFFTNWNLQTAAIPILVAMSPVLGQSILSFAFDIAGTIIGGIWGYITIITWGTNSPYGILFFIAISAFPMAHILVNTPFFVVGLVSMVNVSGIVIPIYLNRHNPNYDEPIVRTYKIIVVSVLILIMVFIFQFFIYPNLARRELRGQLARIFQDFRFYYGQFTNTMTITISGLDTSKNILQMDADLRKCELKIQAGLIRIQPLLMYAAAEPRVVAPFQFKVYKKILQHLQMILDRISYARASVGNHPFRKTVIDNIFMPLLDVRHEILQVNRLLFYIYATTLKSKLPLPDVMPKASEAQNKFFQKLLKLTKEMKFAEQATNQQSIKSEGYLRFYSVALALRGITFHMDDMGGCFRELFGVTEDLAPPDYYKRLVNARAREV
ncbi:hypothetical protein G9A89_010644 [Geosiphon pyriformis]|nr:hypothetical protein G9A89_010644 [Geosiphon pyriformis]